MEQLTVADGLSDAVDKARKLSIGSDNEYGWIVRVWSNAV